MSSGNRAKGPTEVLLGTTGQQLRPNEGTATARKLKQIVSAEFGGTQACNLAAGLGTRER